MSRTRSHRPLRLYNEPPRWSRTCLYRSHCSWCVLSKTRHTRARDERDRHDLQAWYDDWHLYDD